MNPARRVWRWRVINATLFGVLGLTVVVCSTIGPAQISPVDVLIMLAQKLPWVGGMVPPGDWPESYETIIFQMRLARVVLAVLVGAGLASSGVVLQGLLQNPMADPYILGISSGAALGATAAMLFGLGVHTLGIFALPLTAFAEGNPNTGDHNIVTIAIVVMVVMVVAIAALLLTKKKK